MSGWIPKEDRHVDVEGIHKRKGEGKIADYDQIMSSSSVERHKQMQGKEKEEQIMSGL